MLREFVGLGDGDQRPDRLVGVRLEDALDGLHDVDFTRGETRSELREEEDEFVRRNALEGFFTDGCNSEIIILISIIIRRRTTRRSSVIIIVVVASDVISLLLFFLFRFFQITKVQGRKSKGAMKIAGRIDAVLGAVSLQNLAIPEDGGTSVVARACFRRVVALVVAGGLGREIVDAAAQRLALGAVAVGEPALLGLLVLLREVVVARVRVVEAVHDAAELLVAAAAELGVDLADARRELLALRGVLLDRGLVVRLVLGGVEARFDFGVELIAEKGEGEGGVGVKAGEGGEAGLGVVDEG